MNSTAQVVPAVVAVDAHHIHGSFGDVGRVVVLAAYQCDRPVLRVAGVRQLIQRTKVVIRLLWTFPVTIQSWLIGDRPHYYARVVLVARNHASYGVYYWFGSQLTGWDCSDNMVVTATNLHGPWSDFRPFTPEGSHTYQSQCRNEFSIFTHVVQLGWHMIMTIEILGFQRNCDTTR